MPLGRRRLLVELEDLPARVKARTTSFCTSSYCVKTIARASASSAFSARSPSSDRLRHLVEVRLIASHPAAHRRLPSGSIRSKVARSRLAAVGEARDPRKPLRTPHAARKPLHDGARHDADRPCTSPRSHHHSTPIHVAAVGMRCRSQRSAAVIGPHLGTAPSRRRTCRGGRSSQSQSTAARRSDLAGADPRSLDVVSKANRRCVQLVGVGLVRCRRRRHAGGTFAGCRAELDRHAQAAAASE